MNVTNDDLISRAAVLDAIFGCFGVMESKGIDMTVARTIVKGVLDGMPTVDAVPVVHGQWKSIKAVGGEGYPFWDAKCSECGYITKNTFGYVYCPHCGAKMESEPWKNI